MAHRLGRTVSAVMLGVAFAAIASCAPDPPPQGSPPPFVRYSYDIEMPVLPLWTFQDWVTYGDALVLVTVTAESPATPAPDLVEHGFVHRTVTASVDDTVWQRPTLTDDPDLPDTLQFRDSGWAWKHPRRDAQPDEPAVLAMDTPWMSVGSQYLVVVTMFNWHWLSADHPNVAEPLTLGVLALDRGRVVPDTPHFGGPHAVLAGASVEDVADAFDAQPVDPNAAPFMGLNPYERRAKATEG